MERAARTCTPSEALALLPSLYEHYTFNRIPINIITRAQQRVPDNFFAAAVFDGDKPAAVIARGGRDKAVMSHASAAATRELAAFVHTTLPHLFGIQGAVPDVEYFVGEWERRSGKTPSVHQRMGMFEAESVIAPQGIPGRVRTIAASDISLAAQWYGEFIAQALPDEQEEVDVNDVARQFARDKTLFFWEVDGSVVSMAAAAGTVPHGGWIFAVYTPPAHRSHGYASACVAVLTQQCLDGGQPRCSLFTDLKNATSNHIYQEVGYRRIGTAVSYFL